MQTGFPQLALRSRASTAARLGFSIVNLFASVAVLGSGGAAAYWYFGQDEQASKSVIVYPVTRSTFIHEITEQGELQSADNVEIKCEVETGRDGISIVKLYVTEGQVVEKGQLLAELDSSELENELSEQQIQVNTAQATYIQAQNVLETARIALDEYLDGTFRQEKELVESEIFVAEENLKRAQEYYEYSKRLNSLGYVTEVQLQADKFAVDKAQKELETAKTKLSVLENYTKSKMVMTLQSDIRSAEAKESADNESNQLELKRLKFINDQIARCKIYAPASGELVFANEHDRRGDSDFVIEELATVRENQTLFWLPDKSQMQVRVKVNESRIGYVTERLPAAISIDARWGELLSGVVTKVDTYPVPQHWSSSNVREYYVYVTIHNPPQDLRHGLTAQTTITVTELDNVLQIPNLAVLEHGNKRYCAIQTNKGAFELREITVGGTNDRTVVVTSGLEEGDIVAHDQEDVISPDDLPEINRDDMLAQQRAAVRNLRIENSDDERVAVESADRRSTGDSAATSSTATSAGASADRASQ